MQVYQRRWAYRFCHDGPLGRLDTTGGQTKVQSLQTEVQGSTTVQVDENHSCESSNQISQINLTSSNNLLTRGSDLSSDNLGKTRCVKSKTTNK